jgi:hypothetical protein
VAPSLAFCQGPPAWSCPAHGWPAPLATGPGAGDGAAEGWPHARPTAASGRGPAADPPGRLQREWYN